MPSFGGIYRGRVVSNADPMGARRVQVNVPNVLGMDTTWAQSCVPFGATASGPTVGSTVWVMFEAGDPSFPVVIGAIPAGG